MRFLESLFCNVVWLLWIGLSVDRSGVRPEERPTSVGSSGEACRRLMPDRAILPGW